jgi:hypothetical protein
MIINQLGTEAVIHFKPLEEQIEQKISFDF